MNIKSLENSQEISKYKENNDNIDSILMQNDQDKCK